MLTVWICYFWSFRLMLLKAVCEITILNLFYTLFLFFWIAIFIFKDFIYKILMFLRNYCIFSFQWLFCKFALKFELILWYWIVLALIPGKKIRAYRFFENFIFDIRAGNMILILLLLNILNLSLKLIGETIIYFSIEFEIMTWW